MYSTVIAYMNVYGAFEIRPYNLFAWIARSPLREAISPRNHVGSVVCCIVRVSLPLSNSRPCNPCNWKSSVLVVLGEQLQLLVWLGGPVSVVRGLEQLPLSTVHVHNIPLYFLQKPVNGVVYTCMILFVMESAISKYDRLLAD
ncbi:hypothetical protein RB195_026483 [Necator americanus]|uniref:Uncharacterized protein n=1 Tax=Necator americanus TaxID=51031 RepID=A0ABR1EXB9_NECAM